MAPTLSFFKQPKVHSHDKAPPSSPSAQMPNVFVVPPEEDHSPPWCYFNAAEAPPLKSVFSSPPDIGFLHNALDTLHSESNPPVFHRHSSAFPSHIVMPIKGGETRSTKDLSMVSEHSYEHQVDLQFGLESEPALEAVARDRVTGGGAVEDSVAVEVVKLRRREEEFITMSPANCSKSLRSRASKAFRTLKNVGKGSMCSRLNPLGASTSIPVAGDEPPPRDRTPTISRRGSVIFSQFLRSRTSVYSFENQRPRHDSLASTLEERTPASLSSTPYAYPPACPNSPLLDSSLCQDFIPQVTRSPSPTSIQTFSNKHRFSMMSLQRLFSFSSSDPDIEVCGSGPTTPMSMSMSRNSSGPSATSSLGPDTPADDDLPLSLHPGPGLPPYPQLDSDDKHFPIASDHRLEVAPALRPGDLSFDTRLDSLHFETLSFDASRF